VEIEEQKGVRVHVAARTHMMSVQAYEYENEPFNKSEVKVNLMFNDEYYDPEELIDELIAVIANVRKWLSE